MPSQRHLKELLSEDQEPFFVAPKKQLHLTKKKPTQNASFHSNLCKNACLFSSSSSFPIDSPDYRKSPLLSPAALGSKSPSRAMLLHVPAKTAALLLEAACRIHRNSSPKARPESQSKASGFALLGSVIKRLTNRTRTRKLESGDPNSDVIRWADSVKSSRRPSVSNRVGSDSCLPEKTDLVEDRAARLSSVWSEENKSLPSSSSTSTCCSRNASGNLSEQEEKIGFQNGNVIEDFTFCLSPLSPFRFALQKSPSPGIRSPSFSSPVASPSRRKFQEEHVNYEQQDCSVRLQVDEEEEDKEQCSPVSILDPPFGDDDCEEEGECREDEDKFDMECSYAFVQRAKQQLLRKLRKFERLAELDPIELEKRMAEEEEEEEEDLEYEADVEDGAERSIECYLADIGLRSGLVHDMVNPGMKRLLSDLVSEEERSNSRGDNYEPLVKRVCKRLESWKEVDPNTIEMMVAMDLKGEDDTWRNRGEEISQTAKMLELSIFAGLLDELITMS